jgi:Ca2+-binding RTX toxin-like protein
MAVLFGALAMLAPGPALAANVNVHETLGDSNTATLSFEAGPGESNELTVRVVGGNGGMLELQVLDAGAPLAPGVGCSGGGALGAAVICQVHEPRPPDCVAVNRAACALVPGSGWIDSMTIRLGDRDDYFDASSFTGTYSKSFSIDVTSETGDDRILTGGGEDTIDPGPGADDIHSAQGFDRVEATAVADGPDLYDLGSEELNEVSYQRRHENVYRQGSTAGAMGENDRLIGVNYVVGGSGDDVLLGEAGYDRFEGGPGNDQLAGEAGDSAIYGGPGNDVLSGGDGLSHLVGEEGDDIYTGGEGVDIIRDSEINEEPGSTPLEIPSSEGGRDVAYGNGGGDAIELGADLDRGYGGTGNDQLDGGPGGDRLVGGSGNDALTGDRGVDHLLGGSGADSIFSGRKAWHPNGFPFPPAPDDGRDVADCGPGRDLAVSNPWDRLFRCERKHLLTPKQR